MVSFRAPEDMTPEEMMAVRVQGARRDLADHESGRRHLSQLELRTSQRIVDAWGKYETPDAAPDS